MNLPAQLPCPESIWSIEAIHCFLGIADEPLTRPINAENGSEVAERIVELISMFSSAAHVKASAQWYAEEAYNIAYRNEAKTLRERAEMPGKEIFKPLVATSILQAFIRSEGNDYTYLKNRAAETSRALEKAADYLRSILSSLKSQAEMARYGGGGA